MRVLIVGVGSRGDVAPFVGLGQRLQSGGCQVAIATHETFAGMVRAAGLEWRPVSGDAQSLIRIMMRHRSGETARRQGIADYLSGIGDDIADAAELGADVILTCQGQTPLSTMVAAAFGLPSMGTYLAPSLPTAEFVMPGSSPPAGPGAPDYHAMGRQMLHRGRNLYAEVLPRLARRLGLPQSATEDVWEHWQGTSGWPICFGYSPAVVPRPADWPDHVDVVGYWWPAEPPKWQPSPEIRDFLSAGPPPVFIGFGSMAVGSGERLGPVILDAVRQSGVRAVVQSGWAEMSVEDDDVLQVGDLPHHWLFPRMAAVVHHAGAGTTGAALRAGVPAVTIPVLADQPFWAERVHRLGAGPAPIPFVDLTAERLADAIRLAVDEPRHLERAQVLSGLVNTDDGTGAVARRVEQLTS